MKRACLLSLGSNQGDSIQILTEAVKELKKILQQIKVSSLYLSSPVDFLEQSAFYNLCVQGLTSSGPEQLLIQCQGIEKKLGREKSYPKGPREIDVDIIFFGNELRTLSPILPHPEYHKRLFVLHPLLEIEPNAVDPRNNKKVSSYLQNDFYDQEIMHKGTLDQCG